MCAQPAGVLHTCAHGHSRAAMLRYKPHSPPGVSGRTRRGGRPSNRPSRCPTSPLSLPRPYLLSGAALRATSSANAAAPASGGGSLRRCSCSHRPAAAGGAARRAAPAPPLWRHRPFGGSVGVRPANVKSCGRRHRRPGHSQGQPKPDASAGRLGLRVRRPHGQ